MPGRSARRWLRACCCLSLLAVGCCSARARARHHHRRDLHVAPNNLDPRYGTDAVSARAHQLLFNNLVTLDDNMRLAPGLAETLGDDRLSDLSASICARACAFTTATS